MNKDEDFADLTRVPPAWDAWLRYRRKEPPSLEEIEESERYFIAQQEMHAHRSKEEEVSSQSSAVSRKDDKFPKRRDYAQRPHLDPSSAAEYQKPPAD